MSDLDARLTAALESDAPPARDAVFRVDVLVRLERARFRRQAARAVLGAAVLAVLGALSAPSIEAWLAADRQRLWIVVLGTSAALCVLPGLILTPRLRTMARAAGRLLYP